MSGVAERDRATAVLGPLERASVQLLDRLFAPHGASAYFKWVTPGRPSHELDEQIDGDAGAESGELTWSVRVAPAARRSDVASSPVSAPGGSTGQVSFERSGLTAVAEGTLLETAEAAGLSPRFRCRRGICGTCTTDKRDGTVRDVRTGELSDGAGPVRICVSVPCGDVALDL